MSEAFHQWVNNMPWWEKLYYQLFDPQAITCTTMYPLPFGWVLLAIGIAAVLVLIYIKYLRFNLSDIEELL
jgi:hypothetical protein